MQSVESGDTRRFIDNIRFGIGVQRFMLPIWPDVQCLTATLDVGSDSIDVTTAGYDFVAGGSAVLWRDALTWEILSIATVEDGALTLSTPTANAWGTGDRLYPLRRARLQSFPKATQFNDEQSQLQVQCLIDEPCDWPAAWPSSATYRGLSVLEWRNEESEDPTDEFDRLSTTVDQDTGPVAWLDMPELSFRLQSQRFALQNRPDHTAFRSLLYALNGRAGELWVPSWQNDLRMAAAVTAAAITFKVPLCGYTQFSYQQQSRRDVRIELNGGSVLYRRITGSAVGDDGTETLQVDSAFGVDIDPANVRQINFMVPAASASDTFQIDHNTDADGEAVCAINWQAVADDV
jgi:hypothetical protein